MEVILRFTGRQYDDLKKHLYPGDGREAVAMALCGRRSGHDRHCLLVRRIEPIPYAECSLREQDLLTWKTDRLVPLLEEAAKRDMAVLKIHSHPSGVLVFSQQDDRSDRDLFKSVYGWVDGHLPHASAVMLPNGRIFARSISPDIEFSPISMVTVTGSDLLFWFDDDGDIHLRCSDADRKNAQAFGSLTTNLIKRLSIAVVGCSGTGSPVVEQLARLGVGNLVLVDPDRIEEKNLNRILNSTMADVQQKLFKVDVLARAVCSIDLGTNVVAINKNVIDPDVLKAVAGCDIVFGCMDGDEGRHFLNKLAAFYLVPYFDIGVSLQADGVGGVDTVCGSVNYLQADGSSLLSRRVINMEKVKDEGLRRTDTKAYADQIESKYIKGVNEERPAVISVNMTAAALGVNEMLARIHPYRDAANSSSECCTFDLVNGHMVSWPVSSPCEVLAKHAGRGDVTPFLDVPSLGDCLCNP